jgi:hypothetical protein
MRGITNEYSGYAVNADNDDFGRMCVVVYSNVYNEGLKG